MSVLCCYTRDFLIAITCRHRRELVGKPFVVVDEDERVCAASPAARADGVSPPMRVREAQVRCPELSIYPLELHAVTAEQEAFVDTVVRTGLPVETPGFGVAYVDLRPMANTSQKVKSLCSDIGRQLRTALGADLQSSLGWDSGKFTARAAAVCVKPGHLRLVDKVDEPHFLAPLSITLLPLPSSAIQELGWLGIKTLGQFARLSKTAVAQRFGAAGVLAWRLAQGRDDRPVCSMVAQAADPIGIDFDPPTVLYEPVVQEVMAALAQRLNTLTKHLAGIRRLGLELRFLNRTSKTLDYTFLEPVSEATRLQNTIGRKLQTTPWSAELIGVRLTIQETGELMPQQLALFDGEEDAGADDPFLLHTISQQLNRYAGIFYRGEILDETHGVAERRSRLRALG
jgi:protein ImuB